MATKKLNAEQLTEAYMTGAEAFRYVYEEWKQSRETSTALGQYQQVEDDFLDYVDRVGIEEAPYEN
jgi:hypothetical protein